MPEEKELQQHYDALYPTMKELLTSPQTAESVKLIGGKSLLESAQIEALLNEVGLVILGFEEVGSFKDNIMVVLEVDEEKAQAINSGISTLIFSKMSMPKIEVKRNDASTLQDVVRANSKTLSIKNFLANLK